MKAKINVDTSEIDKTVRNFLGTNFTQEIHIELGQQIVNEAKRSITKLTQGNVYYVSREIKGKKGKKGKKRRIKRIAGVIGEAPNNQDGHLRSSITYHEGRGVTAGSGLKYAAKLEYGVHPFLTPAADKVTDEKAEKIALDVIDRLLKR